MLFHVLFYIIHIIRTVTSVVNNYDEKSSYAHIPFCMKKKINYKKYKEYKTFFYLVVMQPQTIINQTLHSYCKEQFEFNTQPMYINLTE